MNENNIVTKKWWWCNRPLHKHVKESYYWLGFTLFFGLIPLIIRVFLMILFQKYEDLFNLFSHGEFYLYSASLLSPTIYNMSRDYKEKNAGRKYFPFLSSLMLLFISIILAASITLTDVFKMETNVINKNVLIVSSCLMLLFSIIISFKTRVIENDMIDFNPEEKVKSDISELNDAIDNLDDGSDNVGAVPSTDIVANDFAAATSETSSLDIVEDEDEE